MRKRNEKANSKKEKSTNMYKTEQQEIKMHDLHRNLFFNAVDKNRIHLRQKPHDRNQT